MNTHEEVVVKITTKEDNVQPIFTIIDLLRHSYGDRQVIVSHPIRNRERGFHCFVNVFLSSSNGRETSWQ